MTPSWFVTYFWILYSTFSSGRFDRITLRERLSRWDNARAHTHRPNGDCFKHFMGDIELIELTRYAKHLSAEYAALAFHFEIALRAAAIKYLRHVRATVIWMSFRFNLNRLHNHVTDDFDLSYERIRNTYRRYIARRLWATKFLFAFVFLFSRYENIASIYVYHLRVACAIVNEWTASGGDRIYSPNLPHNITLHFGAIFKTPAVSWTEWFFQLPTEIGDR